MIWKREARDLIVEVLCIVAVLKAWTEVEDPEVGAVAGCEESLDVGTVIAVQGLDTGGWKPTEAQISATCNVLCLRPYQMMMRSVISSIASAKVPMRHAQQG